MLWRVLIVAAVALLFGWRLLGVQRSDRATRAGMLDAFLPEILGPVVGWSTWRYPRLEGILDGTAIRIDLLPDTLITRTLPTLWLQVRWTLPQEGNLCVTVDPVGAEFFSDDAFYGRLVPTPPSFHVRAEVRTDESGQALLRRLSSLDLRSYAALKQLAVIHGELRLTLRCARGERTIYRVFRAAKFPSESVTPSLVKETLSLARAAREVLTVEQEAS